MAFKKLIRPLSLMFKSTKELWIEADMAIANGSQLEADTIYHYLTTRKLLKPEDYMYSALSEYRLGNQQNVVEILEAGILKFPEADYLLEHYARVGAECGRLERVLHFIDPDNEKKAQNCETLFYSKFADSTIRIGLVDFCLSHGLLEAAEKDLLFLRENHDDSLSLWRLGDVLLKHSRLDEAKKIYQELAQRKLEKPEDYLYAALSEYRQENSRASISLLEEGLEKFPKSESLFENYFRISVEAGEIDRIIKHIDPVVKNKVESCETLFNMKFADSFIRVNLIDYCFKHSFTGFAEKGLTFVHENYTDTLTLWRLGDVLLRHGRNEQAKKIYRELSGRNLQTLEDYYYSGLAEQRLENPDKAFDVLEQGMKKYPESDLLYSLYEQLCAVRHDFERYSRFMKEFGSTRDNVAKTILDFYKLTIRSGAPINFMINFKDIELKCSTADFEQLKKELLISLHQKSPLFDQAKLIMFFSKYLDTGIHFTADLFDVLQRVIDGSDENADQKKHLLGLLYNLTVPMVTHYPIEMEELTRGFIAGSKSLLLNPAELSEPISDMTNNWTPWQYIFCLATPRLYNEAMSVFEQVSYKTWPKLNFTASHIEKDFSQVGSRNKKIRIGFTVHDSMPMMSGLMRRLDKNLFETIFLRPGKAGTSMVAKSWVSGADRTVEYSDTNTYSAIDTIAKEELDIIVSGPSIAAIFFPMMARLARLQIVLLEPNWTDGCINTDYYISWQPAEPENPREFYRTSVSYLEHPPYWIEKPQVVNDPALTETEKSDIRERLLKRGPESRVYLCANTPPKIHPKMDEIFMQLFEKDPSATLVILRGEYPPAKSLKARLKEKLGRYYENVVFLPTLSKDDAHQLLMSVDCCLDSYPLCGMSSSFDGAMLGVPIVTLPADIPFGRWTAAIYDYIGVSGLVAEDQEDYIDIAIKLASDKTWRNQKSVEIKEKSVRYVESEASFNEFQDFIIQAWKRKLSELPPADYMGGQWQ